MELAAEVLGGLFIFALVAFCVCIYYIYSNLMDD